MRYAILLLLGLTIACTDSDKPPNAKAPPRLPSAQPPAPSNPLRQGFTQRPAPDTPGLPPSIPPFLTDDELDKAAMLRLQLDENALAAAQQKLAALVHKFEQDPGPESLRAVREAAFELAAHGRILHVGVVELYRDYLFPNPEDEADAKYKGKLAVFSGAVAPHNMRDFADGFKLVEQNPYIHDPLLLATDYELSFVECRLAHPDSQPLRDWQPIHFLAEVRGKNASDVFLDRCIVL